MERERIINEIKEKLDSINGYFEPNEPFCVLQTNGKAYRVLHIFLNEDHCIEFTLESKGSGRFGVAHGWIATESLLKINKILPTKWVVVVFHTSYDGCDLDWFVSREAIPANSDDPQGELEYYLYKNYPALRWSNTDECEFEAYPEGEDYGPYFIASIED